MASAIRKVISNTPVVNSVARAVYRRLFPQKSLQFERSSQYWEDRYRVGGNSGAGSYGRLAEFKAEVLNRFVEEHGVKSVIEFGSGDGAQLGLARYPSYIGVDVSETAVKIGSESFADDPTKQFVTLANLDPATRCDLALSLDVIYHLVEDAIFDDYMQKLFAAADRFVGVYSSNVDKPGPAVHVRHRCFSDWIEKNRPEWALISKIDNPYPEDTDNPDHTSWADFYFYERKS